MISFILLYVHLQIIKCTHAHIHTHMIATQGILMSLPMKVINKRKLKEPNKTQGWGGGGGGGKSNRFNQENILQILLQRSLVPPPAPPKKWQKWDNSNGCGKGVTDTQDEVGMHLNRTSSPSSIEMRDSNLNKSCAPCRGAAQDEVIESVHGCIAGNLQVSQADPVTSGILLELITCSSLLPLCVSDTESGFWRCDKPLTTIIHLVDRHPHLAVLSRQNWSFV